MIFLRPWVPSPKSPYMKVNFHRVIKKGEIRDRASVIRKMKIGRDNYRPNQT